jgi:hypothetical protein
LTKFVACKMKNEEDAVVYINMDQVTHLMAHHKGGTRIYWAYPGGANEGYIEVAESANNLVNRAEQ